MKKFARLFSAALVVAMVIALLPAYSVQAEPPEVSEDLFGILEEPGTQNRLNLIAELIVKTKAGDSDALRQMKLVGEELDKAFPRGKIVQGDWKHVANTNASDWNFRKFDSVNIPQANSSPRQSAASAGLVPYRSPAPSFSRNMLVTRDVGTPIQNEPHMCVNPTDPQNVVVAAHNYGTNAPPVHVSFDGGETWRGPVRVPLTEQSVFGGDPVLTCAPDGTIYYSYMSIGGETRTIMGRAVGVTNSEIAAAVSRDGGLTWEQPATVSSNIFEFTKYPVELTNPQTGEKEEIELDVLATSFLDKNWIASGPDPNDPDNNAIYVSYTNFTNYMVLIQPIQGLLMSLPLQWTTEIEVLRSTDDGETWEKLPVMDPVTAIEDPGELIEEMFMGSTDTDQLFMRFVQGSQLAVANDGTVYAAWYHTADDGIYRGKALQYVTKSSDGGDTWDEPVVANEYNEIQRQTRSVPFRTTNNPSLAVGPNKEVYLVHAGRTASKPTDDGDIYFVAGREDASGNLSFSEPVLVNKDDSNNIQFFPAVDAGPDGTAHVMWGDTRDDKTGLKYHIYYTKSEDLGKTWGFEVRGVKENDTRVTDFPSNPNMGFPGGRFIGDYFAIDATEDDVFMVWTDSRLAEFGPMNQKIGFARRSAIPSPEIVMNPSSGPSGKEVTIQAHNFQPDMSVFVQVGADISACGGRTDESGFTQCTVLMPVMAAEGVQDVVVYDESGNVATASFFTEVGFDDLARADGSVTNTPDTGQDQDSTAPNTTLVIVVSVLGGALITMLAFNRKRLLSRFGSKS